MQCQSNIRWRFRKILWASQNIWTLPNWFFDPLQLFFLPILVQPFFDQVPNKGSALVRVSFLPQFIKLKILWEDHKIVVAFSENLNVKIWKVQFFKKFFIAKSIIKILIKVPRNMKNALGSITLQFFYNKHIGKFSMKTIKGCKSLRYTYIVKHGLKESWICLVLR